MVAFAKRHRLRHNLGFILIKVAMNVLIINDMVLWDCAGEKKSPNKKFVEVVEGVGELPRG